MSKYEYVWYTLLSCVLAGVCWGVDAPLANAGLFWAGVCAGYVLTGLLNKGE